MQYSEGKGRVKWGLFYKIHVFFITFYVPCDIILFLTGTCAFLTTSFNILRSFSPTKVTDLKAKGLFYHTVVNSKSVEI